MRLLSNYNGRSCSTQRGRTLISQISLTMKQLMRAISLNTKVQMLFRVQQDGSCKFLDCHIVCKDIRLLHVLPCCLEKDFLCSCQKVDLSAGIFGYFICCHYWFLEISSCSCLIVALPVIIFYSFMYSPLCLTISLYLLDSRIACKDICPPHVLPFCVEQDFPLQLIDSHIVCKDI